MSKQLILRLMACVFLGVCSAGALQAARDCSGCGGNCDGVSDANAACLNKRGDPKFCQKEGSGVCQAGCSCNSDGVPNAACACS